MNSRDRLPGVEGLRAVAAAAVLLHHVPLLGREPGTRLDLVGPLEDVFVDLRWGLTLFFALSGFLLFRPFAAAILGGRPLPSISAYARNRGLRILPAYWVILLATAFVLQSATTWTSAEPTALTELDVLIPDLLLLQNYHPDTVLTGIGPAWSLAVELIFYAVLPVLSIAAASRASRSGTERSRLVAVLGAAAVLVAVGLASKGIYAAGVTDDPGWIRVVATLMPLHADLFGYGMLAAVVHLLAASGRLKLPAGWRGATLGAAALVTVGTAVVAKRMDVDEVGQLGDSAIGVACGLILIGVCVPATRRTALQRLLELKPIAWLGLISYSIYLWHVPVILFLRERGVVVDGDTSLAGMALLGAAVTVGLSALTWRFVESPALARKHSMRPTLEDARDEPVEQVV